MKKSEFVSLIKVSLNGGSAPAKSEGKFHDIVLERHIQFAYNEIISQLKDPEVIDQFVIRYPKVEVEYDSVLGLKYSEIPVALLNTVYCSGLRSISANKDQSYIFFLRGNNSQWTYKNLDVNEYFTEWAGRVEGQRVYYDVIPEDISTVLMKVLANFENIGEDDEFDMPAGKDSAMFQMVIQQLQQQYQTPEAYRNDNNANTK